MIDVRFDGEFDVKAQVAYMKDTVTDSHLTAEQQAEHIRLYRETLDEKHRDIVIKTNMLFVASIARRFCNHKLTLSDLMSAGMLGLLKAFDKFELDRNVSFISYARYWVEQYIRKEVAYNSSIVRIPFHSYRQLKKVRSLSEEGYSNRAMQEEMNLSAAKISLLKIAGKEISMNQLLAESDDFTVADTLGTTKTQVDELFDSEDSEFILEKVNELNEREQDILKRRFGLFDHRVQTLQELSELYGLSRERVRQIEAKAIRKLKDMCEAEISHPDHC